MQKSLTILLMTLFAYGTLHAQTQAQTAADDTLKVSLDEAKAYAVIHSNDIRQNAYEVDRAHLIVKQATAVLLPQVSGEASYTYYTKVPASIIPSSSFTSSFTPIVNAIGQSIGSVPGADLTPLLALQNQQGGDIAFPLGQKNAFSAKISLFQTLFNGVYLIGLQGAKMFIDLTKAEKDVKDVDVSDNVIRAYYGTLIARENVNIVSENIEHLNKLLYETQQIYKQGFAEQLDVDRLTLSLSTLKSQIEGLKAQAILAETNLKFQMGYPVDKAIVLTEDVHKVVDNLQPLLDSAPSFNARKEVRLMNVREEINKVKVKKEKYQYLPVLNAFAALGSAAQRDKFSEVFQNKWQNFHYVGIQMQVPIWDNFAKKREWQQTEIDIAKIKLGKLQMQEGFKMQYIKAKTDFENAYRDVQIQKDNITLAKKIYDVAQKKYKEGVGSSLEMTQAETQYYINQAQYLGAVYKALIARTDIDKSLGTE